MKKFIVGLLAAQITVLASAQSLDAPADKTNLNTANVIRAAWELKRLSESFAPGVDTRCYIAELAAFNAQSISDSAEVVSQYQKTESDAFAIQSVDLALKEFNSNDVQKIYTKCKENDL